jgi:hypothetical protein
LKTEEGVGAVKVVSLLSLWDWIAILCSALGGARMRKDIRNQFMCRLFERVFN